MIVSKPYRLAITVPTSTRLPECYLAIISRQEHNTWALFRYHSVILHQPKNPVSAAPGTATAVPIASSADHRIWWWSKVLKKLAFPWIISQLWKKYLHPVVTW